MVVVTQMGDLQEARSSIVKAETTKTHVSQRLEELSHKLQGDAEKLAVYERRSLGVNGTSVTHHTSTSGGSREEQLEAEVAELR
jgi:nucleoprotein TPR